METTNPKNPERKWIRLQEAGLVMALLIPISMTLAAYLFGFTLRGNPADQVGNTLVLIIFFLATGSYCCIRYGAEKRQELKNAKMQEVWAQRHPPAG